MPATGPDFISLQASDLDASQAFYEQYLGLVRSQAGPPARRRLRNEADRVRTPRHRSRHRSPHPFAQPGIRVPRSGSTPQTSRPSTMLSSPMVTTIVSAPIDGPFGRTFTFADPDGYQVTLHDRA